MLSFGGKYNRNTILLYNYTTESCFRYLFFLTPPQTTNTILLYNYITKLYFQDKGIFRGKKRFQPVARANSNSFTSYISFFFLLLVSHRKAKRSKTNKKCFHTHQAPLLEKNFHNYVSIILEMLFWKGNFLGILQI